MKKILFIGLFSLLSILSILSARAYDFEVDGIYYDILSGTIGEVEVTCEGWSNDGLYSGSVVIPEMVTYDGNTYWVTSIGYRAFGDCSGLTSVTIPEGVTSIGNSAFYGCSGLTSVTIPESVTSIGDYAFYGCSGLTSVTIPESVTSIGDYAFSGTSISSPLYNSKVFAYMPKDYSGAYEIPDGIQSIAGGAFYNCRGLTSVAIPESVTSIGNHAFSGTSISSPLYNSKVFAYMPKDYSGAYEIPDGIQSIAGGAFSGCTGLTSVTIPESVTSIGESAFYNCSGLTSVEWNAKQCADFTEWRSSPFYDKTALETITFGNKVEHIPACLCYGCSSLTSVTIPESVTSIGVSAFYNCSGLTSVAIPESVTSIGGYAFYGCSGLTSVTIPEGVTSIGNWAFNGCSGLTSVTIPESVTSIGDGAFSGLTSVTWNAKQCADFTDRWSSPFYDKTALETITFGNKVEHIPAYLCCECSGLMSVTIPESVTSIGGYAFSGTSISSPLYNSKVFAYMPKDYSGAYEIPDGIQSIAGGAFRDCSGLTSVTIPESVTSIGESAFYNCRGLTLVASRSSNPPVCEEGAFDYISESVFFYVPRGSKSAYESASVWCMFKIREFGFDGTGVVTLKVNDESMGRVTGGGVYELNEQVRLVAIPNEGYRFFGWKDWNTDNPRMLTVECDTTLTAIFVKKSDTHSTANEAALSAAPFAYVRGRTAYLSDGLGEVEAFTATGQRVYRGFDRSVTLPHPGVYILRVVADGRRCKVAVR